MKTTTVLAELHYLPSLEYFCLLADYNHIMAEGHEHFVKQSYRNRCYIKTSQGIDMLSVPLIGKHHRVPIREIQIDHRQRWQNIQWRTIESAYRNSPYFEHYADDFRKILYSNITGIFDLNLKMLSFCLTSIRWTQTLSTSSGYEDQPQGGLFDARSLIATRKTYAMRELYHPVRYYQVFGSTFEENLSILDLLFCAGPESGRILQASRKNRLNK